MVLIGLTGPISHGKTTFAEALEKIEPNIKHFESYKIIAEVAELFQKQLKVLPEPEDLRSINEWLRSLPPIVKQVVNAECTYEQVAISVTATEQHPIEYQKLLLHLENLKRNPLLVNEPVTKDNKELYRPFLQWLGGYLVKKVDKDIWYREIMRRVAAARDSGVAVCVIGGLRFPSDANQIRGAGGVIVKVYRPEYLQNDILDPTERERNDIIPDTTIVSNGGIADVQTVAKVFWNDLKNNTLQKAYYARPQP